MKKIFFLLAVVFTTQITFAQNKSKEAQKLMQATHIKETTVQIVDVLFKNYAKQHPTISNEYISKVKQSINYNTYLTDVEKIFSASYSQKELVELTKQAKILSPKLPRYTKDVEQQLYQAGKKFGQYIKQLLR